MPELVLLLLLLPLSGPPAPRAPSPIQVQASPPDVLRMPPEEGFAGGPATWVSAKAAADPDRVLKWEVLDDADDGTSILHAIVREQEKAAHEKAGGVEVAQVPESQCPIHTISSTFSDTPDLPAETFDDLIANSIAIYAGTVTVITPGFTSGAPSELLTLKVQKTLRVPDAPVSFPYLYLFSGFAHFRIGSYIFCGVPSSGWGEPEVGDRILIFVYRWVRQGTPFVSPVEKQLIIENKKGLYMPLPLRRDARLHVNRFDAVVDAVQTAVRERSGIIPPGGQRP